MTDASITLGARPHPEYTHRVEAVHGEPADEFHVDINNKEYEGKLLSASVSFYTAPDPRSDDTDYVAELEIQHRGDRAHLWTLHVAEAYRGRGIGTFLLELFAGYVEQADANRVSGRVKNNGDARAFLANRGFPEDELDVVRIDHGYNPYESVAIGAGTADPALEVAEALEEFDGIPATDFDL